MLKENNEIKYRTRYNIIQNKFEEFIPFKFLVTKSQKFDQFTVLDNSNNEKFYIYRDAKELFLINYIIKIDNKIYNIYDIEDGYIRHFPIYDNNNQIGEIIKPNIVINGNDEYRIYLKDETSSLIDAIIMLTLYLDRLQYNSSYIINKTKKVSYKKSFSKNNQYYNKNWINENFKDEDYFESLTQKTNTTIIEIKTYAKKILKIIIIAWLIIAILIAIIPK